MLKIAIQKAQDMGLNKLLLVCDKPNTASAKVIRNNAGILENEVFDPEENVTVQRYWITNE